MSKPGPWEIACKYMKGKALQTDRFKTAWAEWVVYRRQRRSPLTAMTIERQIKRLEGLGHDDAIRSIGGSIEAGWLGLFTPDVRSSRPRDGVQAGKYSNVRVRGASPSEPPPADA